EGDLTRSIKVEASGEVAALKDNINEMIRNLRETTRVNKEQDWLKTNLARFTRLLQGQKDTQDVARLALSELAPVVSAQHGVFYQYTEEDQGPILKLLSSYAFKDRKRLANRVEPGEGLIGQSLLERQRILVTDVPEEFIRIRSGLGEAPPRNTVVLPVLFEDEVKAVIELASFNPFTEIHLTLLEQLAESIGIVLNTIAATMRTEELLKQSQSLAQELQSQQEELRESNERLERQAHTLRDSEELLKNQREQLQQTNEELEEKAELLARQKAEVEDKNREIELAGIALREKAEQLALTSRYKSQFLANMSHELRTPLNSLLILTQMLADNPEGNLTDKQLGYAESVHSSGTDLLALINDILDMSKIESGTVSVEAAELAFSDVEAFVERSFRPMADSKGLELSIETGAELPEALYTDEKRLQQVLKNLLSNAMKFTEAGRVALRMERARAGWTLDHPTLDAAETVVAFAVSDTGVGIPANMLQKIFEPFQQVDMSSTRRYGGTGLGLSISREIAQFLGGEIRVQSEVGKGSTFTLYLPARYRPPHEGPGGEPLGPAISLPAVSRGERSAPAAGRPRDTSRAPARPAERAQRAEPEPARRAEPPGGNAATSARDDEPAAPASRHPQPYPTAADDRNELDEGDRVLLIVEDDARFAAILTDIARQRHFKVLLAGRGEECLRLCRKHKPDAIMLDIQLPGMEGWTVLDRLKRTPRTRHIPVHIISVHDDAGDSLRRGAFAFLQRPASQADLEQAFAKIGDFLDREVKTLLIVEDDDQQRESILSLVGNGDVNITAVGTGREALQQLAEGAFDCMVLDLRLPDIDGLDLIEQIRRRPEVRSLPIVVYTGRDLTPAQRKRLEELAESVIVKDVGSPERLLDETALFLHRVEASLPESKQRMLRQIRESDDALAGRQVLIVDDDVRNVFALTSLLERHHMRVVYAENGRQGLEVLEQNPDVDIVLMDIMMPEMDGYEAMRAIRSMPRFRSLPIVALTAKAMQDDRQKCIDAGASDYVPKPVDSDQLLSLVRVWLSR
ncbi:MAG: response regulator, partial [Planctomycetes bacterium]|nr:response regulator [Planctomycetota bacterium]